MQIKNIISTLIFGGIISGCAIWGPSYSKPDTSNPKEFPSRDILAVTESANLPAMAWWKSFKDPVLNQLIESALKNNNNIQSAIGNILAAQGQLQQIQSAWIPTASVSAGYQRQAIIGEGYNLGITPSYSFNLFQLIRGIEYAEANYAAQKAAKDAVRLTVISQVAGGYFTLRGQDYLLQLQEQLVKDLGEILDLSKIEYQKGLISLYQLQQYEQQYDNAKAQIPVLQSNIVASQNTLKVLLNENPGDVKRGVEFMQFNSYGVIPANLPSQVLRNRPDIQQSEQQLIAANANIGIATSMFFPSISLTGTLGSSSQQISQLFTSASNFWAETISAAIPILNFSIYGQINQARGQYYTAYYNYIQTVRNAFASVDSDLAAHDELTKSFMIQNKAYDSSELAYKLANSSYKEGLYSKPTLLNNAVTMDNAAITLARNKQSQLNTIVQLYQDLGGGYNYQNTESPNKFGDGHDFRKIL